MTAVADAPTRPRADYREVPIAEVFESPLNPRRHFAEPALQELEGSIRMKGVLTPVLLRDHGEDKINRYEIAAGHRRFRAAVRAGLTILPALVREMTTEEHLEILVVDNDQREDVHPLDQATGYRRLLDRPGYDIPAVAARVDKSPAFISRRLKLLDLIPSLEKRFLQDEFTVSHAELLARLTPDQQEKAAKHLLSWDGRQVAAIKFMESIAADFHIQLKGAPFKLDDAELLPAAGACLACPKRTGTLPDLFADVQGENTCTDRSCYQAKRQAAAKQAVTTARAKGDELVQLSMRYSGNDQAKEGRPLPSNFWSEVKKGTPGAVKCVVMDNQDAGKILYATIRKPKATAASKSKAAPKKQEDWQAKQKRDREKREREEAFRLRAGRAIVEQAKGGPLNSVIVEAFFTQVAEMGSDYLPNLMGTADDDSGRRSGVKRASLIKDLVKTPLADGSLITALLIDQDMDAYRKEADSLALAAKVYRVDLKALRATFDAEQKAKEKPAKAAKSVKKSAKQVKRAPKATMKTVIASENAREDDADEPSPASSFEFSGGWMDKEPTPKPAKARPRSAGTKE